MKLLTSKTLRLRLIYLPAFILLLAGLAHAATPTKKFDAGKKAKITGTIVSRNGDLVTIKVKKESTSAIVNITDNTKIEREKSFRLRKADEDVTGLPLSHSTCATPPTCRCGVFWRRLAMEQPTRPQQTPIPKDATSTGVSM